MEEHYLLLLVERLDALADVGERVITAVDALNASIEEQLGYVTQPEDPQPQESTTMVPPWATVPELDKPVVHYDLVLGPAHGLGPGELLVWFEKGVPDELKEFLKLELIDKHVRYKADQMRMDLIRRDLDAALMDFSQYGITLRIPPFEERHWEFHEEEAEAWKKQRTWGEHNLVLGPPIPPPGRGTDE